MSFVVDQIRRIDGQLDRLQLTSSNALGVYSLSANEVHDQAVTSRIAQLHKCIKTLSTTNSPKAPLVSAVRILHTLKDADISTTCPVCHPTEDIDPEESEILHTSASSYQHDLEWLLISKATTQAYGQILNAILDRTIPLSEDIFYWDDILGSYRHAGLYSIQTSPIRFWDWSKRIYQDVQAKRDPFADGWKHFYGLVRDTIRERSLANIERRVVSPLALVRNEARKKQDTLKRLRMMTANALGVLLGEGLSNDSLQDDSMKLPTSEFGIREHRDKWKSAVAKNIALMEAVLQNVIDSELQADKFDDAIASSTHEDPFYDLQELDVADNPASLKPFAVSKRLEELLLTRLPDFVHASGAMAKAHGKPGRIVRYWLPISIGLISSSTILRIVANRKAEIITWVREFGATVIDFWSNWIIEPIKKVIGTIRHDEDSEVSIMSKRSLQGDRESLERMVVDFVVENPENGSLSPEQIQEVRVKVREGDLTPILKAYEKDMQNPFMGTIRGNLIRALLIQVQKTKVDVEIAMGGIDSLLKSQELVFGFVGLTPGILVCVGLGRWLSGVFGSRRGNRRGMQQGQLIRILRNIDRILTSATPTEFGELLYKDHGLLVCEAHVLRQKASKVLPAQALREFLEEIDDLMDVRTGVNRQLKVVNRIRWAYARWF